MRRTTWLLSLSLLFLLATTAPRAHAQQTIAEARQAGVGANVTVEGTVTRAFGAFVRLQDASGPTGASAIVVRQTSGGFYDDVQDGTITRGTQLQVEGTLSAFYGLLQINDADLSSYAVQGQGSVPAPQSVTIGDLTTNGEDYESELVRLEGVSLTRAPGTFASETTYRVGRAGSPATVELRVQGSDESELGGTPAPDGAFDYTGVLGQFHGQQQQSDQNAPNQGYQLTPVRTGDLQPTRSFAFQQRFVQAQEGSGTVSVDVRAFATSSGDNVSVTAAIDEAGTATGDDVSGFTSPQTLSFSGSDPAPQTLTFDVVDDTDETEGVERLEVTLTSSDGAIALPGTFTLWILDDALAQGTIAAGDSSDALLGQLRQAYGDPPTLGYGVARDSMYRTIYNEGGTVEAIYSGYQVSVDPNTNDPTGQALGQNVNTEHLWPRSKGAENEPALSNMHILAPARSEVNTARSNYAFGEIEDADTDQWYFETESRTTPPDNDRALWSELDNSPANRDDRRFEPRHSKKGDVARAAFYFVMAYPNRADLDFFDQQRETLLTWHREDPVDATEMRRNILQASYQGDRLNPFVVDSTLAGRAYARTEVAVQSIADARQDGAGATVAIEGTVTRVGDDGPYVQDDTGALYVFESEGAFGSDLGGAIRRGTQLQVTGTLSYFNGLLELTNVADDRYAVQSQDNALPDPQTLTLDAITSEGEAYEAELVRVEDFAIAADGDAAFQASTNYPIIQDQDTLTLRIPSGSALIGTSIPRRATFQGVLGQFNGAGSGADQPDTGYQLVALDASDLEALETPVELPDETTIDVTRAFGDPSISGSYRLVALPGQVDRPLGATLPGEAGADWQAYWDDGSAEDYLVQFDGSDRFTLRPGRGFWLLGTRDWSVEATVPTVETSGGAATISLHDGWNIISNPLPVDVAWDAVVAANGGALQPLWRWTGAFQQAGTFASATGGEAFYFFNEAGRADLQIPIPQSTQATAQTAPAARVRTFTLQAMPDSSESASDAASQVQMGTAPDAAAGQDRYDWIAPPADWQAVALRLEAPEEAPSTTSERARHWVRDIRPDETAGATHRLVLKAPAGTSVRLRADGLGDRQAVLVRPATGATYDLRAQPTVRLRPRQDTTRLQLVVGTQAYVDDAASRVTPAQVRLLPNRPNPFRARTTLGYALPKAMDVRLTVYDVLGRRVATLDAGPRRAGLHRVRWDAATVASGVYVVRLTAGGTQHTQKVVRLR